MDPSTNNFKYSVPGLKNFGLRERRPLFYSIPFQCYFRSRNLYGICEQILSTRAYLLKLDNSINVISSLFHKHRCIVSIHSNSFDERNSSSFNKLKMFFLSTLYSRADRIIVVSDDIKKSLLKTKLRDNDIRVIYNPIDIDDVEILSHQKVDDDWYDPSMTYIIM